MMKRLPSLLDFKKGHGWFVSHPSFSIWKGVAVAGLIAMAATFLSEHYGAPTMLFALLMGLGLGFLGDVPSLEPGLVFSARSLLRVGVGLLGAQLGIEQVQSLGVGSIVALSALVILTLACGIALSFAYGRRLAFGLLSGGAVAVCGASAALAISSVLPTNPSRDKDTVLVVITVTVLSTVAMVLYPIMFQALAFSESQIGFLIGATIHDVAQVVGAGYSVGDNVGIIATVVKMLRVATLPVIVFGIHFLVGNSQRGATPFPWFLVLFVLLALVRSVLDVPSAFLQTLSGFSQWMMVAAISAIGVRANLGAVLKVHPSFIVILVVETAFLLLLGIVAANLLIQ
ncbi:YeiH family protein [Nioella sp.]|uniref:YeiH family protein n=1 Tax=Nioella sp. TaxID=1912091 RepID=UPI003A86D270